MTSRVKCPYCPSVFERHDDTARTIQAEDFLLDHITDRHQDMIPDPIPVERDHGVTADD